jgi:hypothetical protein
MIDILLNATFFILPIAGATLLLIKVLFEYIFSWDINRESNARIRSTGIRIIFASISVALGVLLCLFIIWLLFFPAYKIPETIKILGIMLYFAFWGAAGILYRIGRVAKAGTGGGEAKGILNKLFTITADRHVILNPKVNLSDLLEHQSHKDDNDPNTGL